MSKLVEQWIKTKGLEEPLKDGAFTQEAQLLFVGELDQLGVPRGLALEAMQNPEYLGDAFYKAVFGETPTTELSEEDLDDVSVAAPEAEEDLVDEVSTVDTEAEPAVEEESAKQEVPAPKRGKSK